MLQKWAGIWGHFGLYWRGVLPMKIISQCREQARGMYYCAVFKSKKEILAYSMLRRIAGLSLPAGYPKAAGSREVDPEPRADGGVSDKARSEGRSQQLRDSRWGRWDPLSSQRKHWALEYPDV